MLILRSRNKSLATDCLVSPTKRDNPWTKTPPRRIYRPPSESPSPEETDLLSRSFLGGERTEEETGQSLITASYDLLNQEPLWRVPATETEWRTPETTDTQDSYATVPELSEWTERFFNTLLEQKKLVKLDINTMSGGPSDEGPSGKKRNPDVEMIDGTPKPI